MKAAEQAPEILTPQQAAELLQCTKDTVIRLANLGRLKAFNIGSGKRKHYRFRRSDLIGGLPVIVEGGDEDADDDALDELHPALADAVQA